MKTLLFLTWFKGLVVAAGIAVLLSHALGVLSTSTSLALLSLELSAYWGVTIGSMVKR